MITSPSDPTAPSPPTSCHSTVGLQVIHAGQVVDRFDLPEGKCTIGSSPSCQFRLQGDQVRPLQCLIVRNSDQFTATRWAAGVQLNGEDFTTAPFSVGDVLSIGEVRLQLVSADQLGETADEQFGSSVALIDQVAAQVAAEVNIAEVATRQVLVVPSSSPQEEVPSKAEAELARLHSANQQARQRFRRLIGALRELRDEAHGLDQHVSVLTEQLETARSAREKLATELHQTRAVAEERESQFGEELDRAIAELSASYERISAAEQTIYAVQAVKDQLQEQVLALVAECEQLRNFQAVHASDRELFEQELAHREAQLNQLRDENAELHRTLEAAVTELQQHNDSLRNELAAAIAERERQVEELRAGLEASVYELHEQNESLRTEVAQLAADRDQKLAELQADLQTQLANFHGENDILRGQLVELSNERDRQIALCESLDTKSIELRTQYDAIQSQLSAAHAQRESEVAALRLELEQAPLELEAQLADLRSERQKLAEEKHHLTEQLEDSEKRIRLLEIDVRSANAEWQRAQSMAARLQDELLSAEAHAADLDAKLADFQCIAEVERAAESDYFAGDLAATRQQLKEREIALAQANAHREQLATELSTALANLSECQSHLDQISQEMGALKSEAAVATKEQSRLARELADRESRIVALTAEVQRLQDLSASELKIRDSRIDELTSKLEDIRRQLTAAEYSASERELFITSLTQEVQRLQEQSAQELTAKESRLTDLSSELESVRQHLAKAETLGSERESRVAVLTQELQRLQEQSSTELKSKESRLSQLTIELEGARQQLAAAENAKNEQINRLAQALEQSEARLKTELTAKESQVAEITSELKSVRDRIASEISSRDARITELAESLRETRNQLTSGSKDQQKLIDKLNVQLRDTTETTAMELVARENRIAQLASELRDTQDQLQDCAAQGERLNELYQQAQADLAALSATMANVRRGVAPIAEEADGVQRGLPQPPSNADPRDDEDPRLIQALASLAGEDAPTNVEQPAEEFQPASFIDRYNHILEEDTVEDLKENNSTVATLPQRTPELTEIASDDSDALEAYMANMMKRVRGESSSNAITPPVVMQTDGENSPAFSNPVARMDTLRRRVATTAIDPPEGQEKLIDLKQLKETSQKPPLPTNLLAMRELANISARQAIAKHRKRRHFEGALSKLLVSGIAGGTAAYMLLTADDLLSPYFLAGCGVAIVSGYWGFKLLGILLEMIRDGINNEHAPAELDAVETPLPIDGMAE
jgi:chromosome segregation ATPase